MRRTPTTWRRTGSPSSSRRPTTKSRIFAKSSTSMSGGHPVAVRPAGKASNRKNATAEQSVGAEEGTAGAQGSKDRLWLTAPPWGSQKYQSLQNLGEQPQHAPSARKSSLGPDQAPATKRPAAKMRLLAAVVASPGPDHWEHKAWPSASQGGHATPIWGTNPNQPLYRVRAGLKSQPSKSLVTSPAQAAKSSNCKIARVVHKMCGPCAKQPLSQTMLDHPEREREGERERD